MKMKYAIYLSIYLFNILIADNDNTPDFSYQQSTLQAFYLINEVLIDGNPIEDSDWVIAYKNDVCVGSRQWDTSQCGNGVCDVPVMGDDGSDGTNGYMNIGDMPIFKVYDSSKEELIDMNFYNIDLNSGDFSWKNSSFFSFSELINSNYSFDNNASDFENTATITSIFSDDVYQMGAGDILVAYSNNEIRSIAVSDINEISNVMTEYIFFSSIFLNESINDLVFKYYNNEHRLILDIDTSFDLGLINADDSFGDALDPVILRVEEDQLGISSDDIYKIDSFSIINAYPNPFNPILNIELNIKNSNYLNISIIDINGKEVDKVFVGYKNRGKYHYRWDASKYSSGDYFIVLKNLNNDILLEKICLLK